MKIIIIPDDHALIKESYTFIIYDTDAKKIEFKKEKIEDLDCVNLKNQGRPTFRPFGIALNHKHILIASNDRLAYFNKENYNYLNLVNVPLFLNTHQILLSQDSFFTCNTSIDTIGIHKEKSFHLSVIDYSLKEAVDKPLDADEKDVKHVNSLCEHDNNIYFCLHNKNKSMSEYLFFNKDTYKVTKIGDAGFCSHNIKIVENNLYSLSSATGDLIQINLESKDVKYYSIVDPSITFLRGLDYDGNNLIIGCSNRHNQPIKENNCYIATFNIKNKELNIPFYLDEIFVITDFKIL
jgi:hypothetical protein